MTVTQIYFNFRQVIISAEMVTKRSQSPPKFNKNEQFTFNLCCYPNKVCFNTTLLDKIVHVWVVLGTGTGDYNMDNVAFKKLLQLAIVFGPKHSNGNETGISQTVLHTIKSVTDITGSGYTGAWCEDRHCF